MVRLRSHKAMIPTVNHVDYMFHFVPSPPKGKLSLQLELTRNEEKVRVPFALQGIKLP